MNDLRALYGDGLSVDGAVIGQTLAEIRDALVRLGGLAQQNPAPQSSVELETTAKGTVKITVKTYGATTEEAAATAQRVYDEIFAKYAAVQS
jgi:hypothetical protein